MQLRCVNKKCLHEWDYKGKITEDKQLITCSKCHYRNPLKKLIITHSQENNSFTHNSLTHNSLTHKKTIVRPQTEFIEDTKEKVFTNLSDFNLEVHKRKLENKYFEGDYFEIEKPEKRIDWNVTKNLNGKDIILEEYEDGIGIKQVGFPNYKQ